MSAVTWSQIDTVLLDMDGTLLDLHFDNYFWLEHLPKRFAELRGISQAQAHAQLVPMFHEHAGQLNWYCLDFWSRALALSIVDLKIEIADKIAPLPGAHRFLEHLKSSGKKILLVTNAHRDSLNLKMQKVPLTDYFNKQISSHDYGYPKEHPEFWSHLEAQEGFNPSRSLFIDDSLAVLRSAQRYGIQHLRCVSWPDTQQAVREANEFQSVTDLTLLLDGL